MSRLIDEPAELKSPLTVVFAHGAGIGMDSEFMATMASLLCLQGIRVVRFEFSYMAGRRESGIKRPPDRMPLLLECFAGEITANGGADHCVAVGKSMGGRVASLLLAQHRCKAAVALGYPLQPPKKSTPPRIEHWKDIDSSWLVVQGSRDPFGSIADMQRLGLPASAQVLELADGDHDFKPRQRSGFNQQQHLHSAATAVAQFVKELA